jgi:anti-sigma factor ChrR (cupin superfamily)
MKALHNRLVLMIILAMGLISWSVTQAAQEKKMQPQAKQPEHVMVTPTDLKWGDAPPALPPGAKVAVLEGDPTKPGPYTIRLKTPANYKIPAHWHTKAERVTIISGAFNIGMGDKLDPAKGNKLPAGSFFLIPAKMNHFAWGGEETIVQINGNGPFDIHYINPADDPRNKK